MVEPQQQRSDRDRDRRQHPVGMTGGADNDGQNDRRSKLKDRRDRDISLDPLPLRALRPRGDACRGPDRVDKHSDHDHPKHCDQHSRDATADHRAPADQPKAGECRLNQSADPPHPSRPGRGGRQIGGVRCWAQTAGALGPGLPHHGAFGSALAHRHGRLLSLTLEQPGGRRQPSLEVLASQATRSEACL